MDLVDTGLDTPTGGRLSRLRSKLDKTFLMAWTDGVSDLDVDELLSFHQAHGKLATVVAVRPPARFGRLSLDGDRVESFQEKPKDDQGWINGGYFVLEPRVLEFVADDSSWEREPLQELSEQGELMAYRHHGFWQCMDTLKEKEMLEQMWLQPNCPWRLQ